MTTPPTKILCIPTIPQAMPQAMPPTAADPRWARIIARDTNADGHFWYSVVTTGVYCRPSCPSRTAHPKNVRLHATLKEAQATGYRACRRCNPDGASPQAQNAALIEQACRMIETAELPPSLETLAKAVQLSAGYFQRLFKAQTGLTPKAYATAHRARRIRDSLTQGTRITQALHDAGFGSNSRFYQHASALLGMTPSQYRKGGVNEVLHFAVAQCSLGALLVASSATGVVAILLGDDPQPLVRDLQDRFPNAELVGAEPRFEAIIATIIGYIDRPDRGLDLPLDIRGTAFQQRVWQALRGIPAGQTLTYTQVARRIGAPAAVRAVARACAANPMAVAIPCHRVIRQDGSLSGYRWGIERKKTLLAREAGEE